MAEKANDNSKNIITSGNGLNPSNLNFDLIKICSDRLKMIQNFNEDFSVDVDSNSNNIFEKVSSVGSGENISYASNGGKLIVTNNAIPAITKVENTDSNIIYSGSWGVAYDTKFSNGSERVSNAVGAYSEYSFYNNKFEYITDKGSDHGQVEIFIDNVSQGIVDGYSATSLYQQTLFSMNNLNAGQHTAKIVILSSKNSSSTGTIATLDYFNVYNPQNTEDFYIKTPIKFLAPGFLCKITVEDDSVKEIVKTSSRVGLLKDSNNWVLCDYNKVDGRIALIQNLNGVVTELSTTSFINITAPFDIILLVKNNIATFIINKDGVTKTYTQVLLSSFNLKDPSVLQQFTLSIGGKINYGESLVISNVSSGYDQGVCMGADYKLITYEDGTPLKHDDSYYFTASEHSSNLNSAGSGCLIYKININSLNVEFAGVVFTQLNDTDIHGDQTCKIFYDRNLKCFVYLANDFQGVPKFRVGKTTTNLL